MLARAYAKYVRVSPRKARQVIDLLRGKNVEAAFDILLNCRKKPAVNLRQVLTSAVDSAAKKTEGKADASVLYISKITACDGPMLSRYKAAPMGRATPIRRRTSHILIELEPVAGWDPAKAKKAAKTTTKKAVKTTKKAKASKASTKTTKPKKKEAKK